MAHAKDVQTTVKLSFPEAQSVHCSDRVWPAAETLLAHMAQQDLHGARILELGAGTGGCVSMLFSPPNAHCP